MTLPLSYVDVPDCPPGMTLDEYRRRNVRPPRRTRRLSLRRRVLRSASRRRQSA